MALQFGYLVHNNEYSVYKQTLTKEGQVKKTKRSYKMRNFKLFNRNLKAISPIFATLILIAIVVIAGVVVYMFTSGTLATMTSSTSAGQEKVAVQGVAGTTTAPIVYAQNMGSSEITVTSILFKNANGAVIAQGTADPATIAANALGTPTVTVTTGALSSNTPYTATLVTSNGGSFVSSSFTLTA